jgi:guanylate kinase
MTEQIMTIIKYAIVFGVIYMCYTAFVYFMQRIRINRLHAEGKRLIIESMLQYGEWVWEPYVNTDPLPLVGVSLDEYERRLKDSIEEIKRVREQLLEQHMKKEKENERN